MTYDLVSVVADGALEQDIDGLLVSLTQLPMGYIGAFKDGSIFRPVEIDGDRGIEILVRRDVRQSVFQAIRAADFQVV